MLITRSCENEASRCSGSSFSAFGYQLCMKCIYPLEAKNRRNGNRASAKFSFAGWHESSEICTQGEKGDDVKPSVTEACSPPSLRQLFSPALNSMRQSLANVLIGRRAPCKYKKRTNEPLRNLRGPRLGPRCTHARLDRRSSGWTDGVAVEGWA